ncbi:MAG: hypothetical protein ACYC99_05980 [Candidatus Geothermincolia bacterium]
MRFTSLKHPGAARAAFALVLFALVRPDVAFAYLGPGAGLGMVGTLISVVVAIFVAILGVVLYPIRLYRRWRKNKDVNEGR